MSPFYRIYVDGAMHLERVDSRTDAEHHLAFWRAKYPSSRVQLVAVSARPKRASATLVDPYRVVQRDGWFLVVTARGARRLSPGSTPFNNTQYRWPLDVARTLAGVFGGEPLL